MTKVLYPDVAVTIHKKDGSGAYLLFPGQFVNVDELPDYQQEAALSGKIPFVRVVDEDEAHKLVEEAERVKNLDVHGEGETPEVVSSSVAETLGDSEEE